MLYKESQLSPVKAPQKIMSSMSVENVESGDSSRSNSNGFKDEEIDFPIIV
jgi:hypothetical protein